MDYVKPEKYEELKRHSYQSGDIIMTKLGNPLGESAIVEGINDGLIVADLVRIRASKVDTKYLCYHLNSPVTQTYINEQQKGTTRPRVRISVVRELPIFTPPLSEQKRIVKVLDKVFADIEKARATAETNLKNARELFDSYLQQVFSQRGEGCKIESWSDILQIKNGKNQRDVENPAGKYPIVGSAGKIMSYADDFICDEGTTIIGRKGTINNPIFIDTKFWNVDTAFGLHALERLDKKFLYYFCLSYDFTKRDKGSGRPSLVKSDLLTITMPVPELDKQKVVVQEIERIDGYLSEVLTIYKKKLDFLEDLKKSILQKAFSGELTKNKVEAA
jgi:type I restriction enzyme S subunit